MIYKGEEFPECSLLYEKPTTEVNGVTVVVKLHDTWRALDDCKEKIKDQLAYLDNVYYDIPGFDNSYNIYRTEHFQFSPLRQHSEMHISLKNISYPIDWSKLGIPRLNIPIALRFDTYEDLKPIFNRESLQYNTASIKAIKQKIQKVADYFIEKWNSALHEYETFQEGRKAVLNNTKVLQFFDRKLVFDAEHLFSSFATIPLKKQTVKGIPDLELFVKTRQSSILECFNAVAKYARHGERWRKVRIQHEFASRFQNGLDDDWEREMKAIIVDFNLNPYEKAFLQKKYDKYQTIYFVRLVTPIALDHIVEKYVTWFNDPDNPKARVFTKEEVEEQYQTIIQHYTSAFEDMRGMTETTEFLKWKEAEKQALKSGQSNKTGFYNVIDKKKGDMTLRWARQSLRNTEEKVTYDAKAMPIEEVTNPATFKKLIVYSTDKFPPSILAFNRIGFAKLNPTEEKHIKNLTHFKSMEEFKNSKPMARLATALYIQELLYSFSETENRIKTSFPKVDNLVVELRAYLTKNNEFDFSRLSHSVKKTIIEHATETNNWDFTIFHRAEELKNVVKQFGFVTALVDLDAWRVTEFQKEMARKIMYIILKHQKMTDSLLEEYDLVKKPEIEEPSAEEITEPVTDVEENDEDEDFVQDDDDNFSEDENVEEGNEEEILPEPEITIPEEETIVVEEVTITEDIVAEAAVVAYEEAEFNKNQQEENL